jgi:hypothetical protein
MMNQLTNKTRDEIEKDDNLLGLAQSKLAANVDIAKSAEVWNATTLKCRLQYDTVV